MIISSIQSKFAY